MNLLYNRNWKISEQNSEQTHKKASERTDSGFGEAPEKLLSNLE